MNTYPCRHVAGCLLVPALSLFFLGFGLDPAEAQNGAIPVEEDTEAEVLTRGPVHEAFAETLQLNPQPGIAITKAPPEPVEELAPDQKPEGQNVVWIPGYWAWDDERFQFLWVSGVWRNTPPGRQWVPGYWNSVTGGHQWISGYWTPVEQPVARTEYLSAPPASLEYGPQVVAPSDDYIWVPGSWVWQGRYVWRPGYWVEARPDRLWVPATYVWTPEGYVYVEGYWDYPIVDRGVLFAPVYWEPAPEVVYVRYYSPTVVINLAFLSDCLFVRPRFHHYYFGDYYDLDCRRRGYYTVHAWYSRNRGCEPLYAYRRWENRHDRDWDRRQSERDDRRRNDPESRPSRRYASGKNKKSQELFTTSGQETVAIATPLAELSKQNKKGASGEPKLKKLEKAEREAVTQQARAAEKAQREEVKTAQKAAREAEKTGKTALMSTAPATTEKAPKGKKVQTSDGSGVATQNGKPKVEKNQPVNGNGQAVVENKTARPEKVKEDKLEKQSQPKVRPWESPTGQSFVVQEKKAEKEEKRQAKVQEEPRHVQVQQQVYPKSSNSQHQEKKVYQQEKKAAQESYRAPKPEKNTYREEKQPKVEKVKEDKPSQNSQKAAKESGGGKRKKNEE